VFHNKKKNGELFWEAATISPIQNDEGTITHYLAIKEDITERKKLEEQLRQAQKMEAVGQLAGGIAHDFNNILTAIIGYGNIALMKIPEGDPLRSYLGQMLAAAERAAALTKSLLAFSRKQIINLRPVSVNAIIERVEKLLQRSIGEDIELKTALTEKDTAVLADSGQIEQVLINLAMNARDAMPNGGNLIIETGQAEIDDQYIKSHGYGKLGMYVLISVTDSGEGMDEKTRDRIFEPFFTTKEVGKGTGLGLSMVYGSVKQHSGFINVYSEPGRGTTFTIYLPLLKAGARPAAAGEPAPPPKGGTETILLAEDDTALRNLARGVLEEFGYTVIEAVDGQDAVEKFIMLKDRIQLLILDVVMPKKNGKEAFEEAKKIKPGIKALFTSGYPAEIIQKKGILDAGINFIIKPHQPQDLLRKIREVLDG
jgi:signal transduction histidine kinase